MTAFQYLAVFSLWIWCFSPGMAQGDDHTTVESLPPVTTGKISVASKMSLHTIPTTQTDDNSLTSDAMTSQDSSQTPFNGTDDLTTQDTVTSGVSADNVKDARPSTVVSKLANEQTDSPPAQRTNPNKKEDTNLIRSILSQMVPELRKLAMDRLKLNSEQTDKLSDFAQSLLNSRNNTFPDSIEDLLSDLLDSGLFPGQTNNGTDSGSEITAWPPTISWPKCQLDLFSYINGLRTSEPWAIQMLDSSGKPGRSMLLGNLKFMGNYIQCNDIHYRNAAKFTSVDGRMCRAVISPPFKIPGADFIAALNRGLKLYWDICLPEACEDSDLNRQLLLSNLTQYMYIYCTPDLDMSDDTGAIIALMVLSILAALLLLGTLMELAVKMNAFNNKPPTIYNAYVNGSGCVNKGYHETTLSEDNEKSPKMTDIQSSKDNGVNLPNGKENGFHHISHSPKVEDKKPDKPRDETASLPKWQRALLAFSIPRNTGKILGVKAAPGSIGCLHGIRVLSMGWVILGHTIIFMSIFENPVSIFSRIKTASFQLIINATLSVDSFFLLSGLLTAYLFMKECGKKGCVTLKQGILYYVHRYWRLTPPLMIWIMVVANIIKYVGEGRPLWTDYVGAQVCRDNWWTNLLYINNVYKQKEPCLGVTWFLAHDMQFYVLAPLALVPWAFGYKVVGFLVSLVFLGVHLASTIWIEIDINADMLRNQEHYSEDIYFKPWTRSGPFAIGLMMGWILWKTKCKARLPKGVVAMGWLMSLGLMLVLTLVTYDENRYEDNERFSEGWSHAGRTTFETLKRPLWALALSWIVFACSHGYGGIVNSILSWEGWLPMSRLTYSAFLVHLTILLYEGQVTETLIMFTLTTLTYKFLATFILAYAVGFILAVCVEAPMLNLEKVALAK